MAIRTRAPAAIWSSPTRPEDLQPFRLRGGTRGCLLIHGFAGTPPEVRELSEHLAAHGYDVLAPLLKGHGLTPEAMAQTRWTDWVTSADEALRTLQADCREVFVGGQSLGGSVALHLAAQHSAIKGVVTMGAMGTPRFFTDWRLRFLPVLKYVVRWHVPDPADSDLSDPTALASLKSYARRPTVSLENLMQFLGVLERELPSIHAPVLLLHGRYDRTVPTPNAPFILERLGSEDKQLVWLERSGHAITVDLERRDLNARVLQWLQRH